MKGKKRAQPLSFVNKPTNTNHDALRVKLSDGSQCKVNYFHIWSLQLLYSCYIQLSAIILGNCYRRVSPSTPSPAMLSFLKVSSKVIKAVLKPPTPSARPPGVPSLTFTLWHPWKGRGLGPAPWAGHNHRHNGVILNASVSKRRTQSRRTKRTLRRLAHVKAILTAANIGCCRLLCMRRTVLWRYLFQNRWNTRGRA